MSRARRTDALLALAFTVAGLIAVAFYASADRLAAGIGLTLLQGLGLAFRRRAPVLGLACNLGAYLWLQTLGARLDNAAVPQFFALVFGVYSAGANLEGWRLAAAAAAVPPALAVAMAIDPFADSAGHTVEVVLVLWVAPMLAGRVVRSRGELNRLLRARAETLRAQRERSADDAVAEERERIAGELHDVVAHALGAMVVQAGAARRRAAADPSQARAAFEAVEGTGREALTEIRRLLGVLRRDDEELALAPQPSLAHVSGVVRRARLAGLEVHLRIEGDVRPLPAGVDLTAYRVVQLALRSAANGAGAGRADVRVRYGADDLVVEVRNDGGRVVRPALAAALGFAMCLGACVLGMSLVQATFPSGFKAGEVVWTCAIVSAAWLGGRAVRTRTRLTEELHEAALDAEEAREASAGAAVAEERRRIAREMHDIVAHSVSVMVVQAGGARRILDRDVERAIEAAQRIEDTGRAALLEMRRLLGILSAGEDEAHLAPQPTLEALDALVEGARTAGLPVAVRVEGERRPLPPGVDLAAYRVLQEAITNALKHAGAAPTDVCVRYGDDDLELSVTDRGSGSGRRRHDLGRGGHGVVGMRERVRVFGGELVTGRRRGGGFEVRARVPLDLSSSRAAGGRSSPSDRGSGRPAEVQILSTEAT